MCHGLECSSLSSRWDRATSATTHVVLGQFKTCVILLGGFLLFGSNPGPTSILGAAIALMSMSFYTYLNLQSRQQSAKALARQSTLPLSKSKLGKEDGDIHVEVVDSSSKYDHSRAEAVKNWLVQDFYLLEFQFWVGVFLNGSLGSWHDMLPPIEKFLMYFVLSVTLRFFNLVRYVCWEGACKC